MANENPLEITQITLGEVYRRIVDQGLDVSEIKADVKAQNGTVADLKTRIALLEDRGNRDTTARASGLSALIAAASALIWQWISKP